jgi:hypothetical protein
MKRCNDYWNELATHFCGATTGESVKQFLFGYLAGQAAKVKLGACLGCMFAPPHADAAWTRDAVHKIAEVYGLLIYEHKRQNRTEFWMLRDLLTMTVLQSHVDDNFVRAMICGLSHEQINLDHVLEAPV